MSKVLQEGLLMKCSLTFSDSKHFPELGEISVNLYSAVTVKKIHLHAGIQNHCRVIS